MLSSKVKDFKNRKLFLKVEKSQILYKFILINLLNNPFSKRTKSLFLYKYFKRFNAIKYKTSTRILNKCVISNRNRKVFSQLKLSRLIAKELLAFGLIPGYKKSIW